MLRRVSQRDPPALNGPGGASRRRFTLDLLLSAVDDPAAVHRSVLRLTYVIAPAVVAIAFLARVLGMIVPVWLIVLLASLMMAAAGKQDRLLSRGRFAPWMPAAHLNLGLVLLTIWVSFSGGAQSPFVWVYAVAVGIYGLLWGRRWGLVTAILCSAYLLAATFLDALIHTPAAPWLAILLPLRALFANHIAVFFLTAVVSGTLRRQVQEIFHEALTDELTGLANRRALRDTLDRELARAGSTKPLSLLVVELDGFKAINDRLGHLEGDQVLKQVADILRDCCRSTDALARFGGDEFVAVLPQTSRDEALIVAKRIRAMVEGLRRPAGTGMSTSVGLATFPDDGLTVRELIEAADLAMYRVKARGGNSVGARPDRPTHEPARSR